MYDPADPSLSQERCVFRRPVHSVDVDMNSLICDVERRDDGAILVRVHSANTMGERLPDAVFTFRRGDPQYEYWVSQWQGKTRSRASVSCS